MNGTVERFGRIDILFNNAGICAYGLAHELTEEAWDAMLDINLKGAWLVARRVIPVMIRQESGVIINNSSVAGLRGMGRLSHYAASKWGLTGLTKSWAIELAPHGIRVNSIHPTGVNTPMNDGLAALEGLTPREIAERSAGNLLPVPWIEPEDVAAAVLYLASDRARYVTGAPLDSRRRAADPLTRPGEALPKAIGRVALTGLVLNSVIGSSVFGLPSVIAGQLGRASPWAWVIAGLGMVLVVAAFAEVASRFTRAGGTYLYARVAFGRFAGIEMAWLTYLVRLTAAATNANLFVIYLAEFWPGATAPVASRLLLALVFLPLVVANYRGVRGGVWTSSAFAVTKLAPLGDLPGRRPVGNRERGRRPRPDASDRRRRRVLAGSDPSSRVRVRRLRVGAPSAR